MINGLDQDLTDDAQRGMREAVTMFYNAVRPPEPRGMGPVSVVAVNHMAYHGTVGYISFLAMSVLALVALVTGMLQGGMAAARDYETGTVKALMLAPVSQLAILTGRMIGAFTVSLPSLAIVLAVVLAVTGGHPANLMAVIGVSLLTLACFTAAGLALGVIVKDHSTVAVLVRAVPVPLFFLSGVFGTLTYQTQAVQATGVGIPTHYAVVLEQLAFKGFSTGTLTPLADTLILAGYVAAFMLLAAVLLGLRRRNFRILGRVEMRPA